LLYFGTPRQPAKMIAPSSVNFVTNRRGSVLVYAKAGDFGFFLWHDGRLDVAGGGGGLTDHDEVVMLDRVTATTGRRGSRAAAIRSWRRVTGSSVFS
jgi:hypothetical protein